MTWRHWIGGWVALGVAVRLRRVGESTIGAEIAGERAWRVYVVGLMSEAPPMYLRAR